MTKQEFLAMSLSKGLVLQSPYGFRPNGKESTGIFRLVYLTGDLYADIENKTFPEEFIPVCRPLSDLTKPIEHKGETFVPIVRLLDTALKTSWSRTDYWKVDNSCNEWFTYMESQRNNVFGYNQHKQGFYLQNHGSFTYVENQLQLFQKLLKWHFDLFGGIESGEAIDVNTLDINPYK